MSDKINKRAEEEISMSEPEPIYMNDTPSAKYWFRRAAQERGRAKANLRLATERASEIQELSEELKAAKAQVDRLSEIIRKAEWAGINMIYDAHYCLICGGDPSIGHQQYCPFYKWEGGE